MKTSHIQQTVLEAQQWYADKALMLRHRERAVQVVILGEPNPSVR